MCENCNTHVDNPDLKYNLTVKLEDATGSIWVRVLGN